MIKRINLLLDHIPHKRFIIFSIGGVIGMLVNLAITIILTEVFLVWYRISYAIGLAVNLIFNFVYNRHITFKKKTKMKRRFVKFVIVSLSTILLNYISVIIVTEYLGISYILSIVMVVFLIAIINYLLNKVWVFNVK